MRASRSIAPLLTLGRELPNLHAFQRLREAVFARELRWIQESAAGLERDSFDADCVHVAVSHGWHAAGYLRIPRHLDTQPTIIWTLVPCSLGHLIHVHLDRQSERSDAGLHC